MNYNQYDRPIISSDTRLEGCRPAGNVLPGASLSGMVVKVNKDYDALKNKPSINGVELVGNKTPEELGLGSGDYDDLYDKPSINGVELVGNKTAKDLGLGDATDYDALANKPRINDVVLEGDLSAEDLGIHDGQRYAFAEGDVKGAIEVTPEGGEAQNVPVHGLQDFCFEDVLSDAEILSILDGEIEE